MLIDVHCLFEFEWCTFKMCLRAWGNVEWCKLLEFESISSDAQCFVRASVNMEWCTMFLKVWDNVEQSTMFLRVWGNVVWFEMFQSMWSDAHWNASVNLEWCKMLEFESIWSDVQCL